MSDEYDFKTPGRKISQFVDSVKSAPGKIIARADRARQDVETGVAKAVGHFALDVRGVNNLVTRTAVDAAASVAPRDTTKASLGVILNAPSRQLGAALDRAAGRAIDRVDKAIRPTIDRIDRAERKVGDVLQRSIGTRNPIVDIATGAVSAVKKARGMAKEMMTPQERPGAPGSKPSLPKSGDATVNVAKSAPADKPKAEKGTYTTIDGRTVDGTEAQKAAWLARRKDK